MDVITKSTQCPVIFMGISVSKFVPSKESGSFLKFFKNVKSKNKKVGSLDSLGDATNSTSSSEVKGEMPCTAANSKQICSLKKTESQKSIRVKMSSVVKESSVKNDEGTVKGNTRSINNLNTSAEDSPMSKRVSKLIQVCNKHDETKNKRLSGLVIDNNDFQDSFFMNIYKTGEKECYDKGVDMGKSKCRKQLITSSEDDGGIDDHNTDLYVQENACEIPSTSHAHTHVKNSSSEESVKETNEGASMQEPSVRLEEIFPNLDDIDPDILSLLPADLQEEARLYVKSRDKKQENVKVARELPKTGRGKPSKSKIVGKRRPLYNFLIKTNVGEHNVPLERCAQCDQMIPMTRFSEHMDFHVAQNLYQEINKPTSSESGGAKRKLEEVTTFVKRQTSNICKPDRNS